MHVFEKIEDVRKFRWLDGAKSWGLVPTMGFLHEGHLSLVRRARKENDRIAVSIFVNPKQFNDEEDLIRYPRNVERDLRLLKKESVDLVWTPPSSIVYPPSFQTDVVVKEITRKLEGAARPGHFKGVATVVAKLFNVFQPNRAYFGRKDAQQVAVVRRMVKDLNFNIEIIECPTKRENDGLAMSSRNANLSPEGRRQAVCLFLALKKAKQTIDSGIMEAKYVKNEMKKIIASYPAARIDYVSVADLETLEEIDEINRDVLISGAIFIEGVRLIDNIKIRRSDD